MISFIHWFRDSDVINITLLVLVRHKGFESKKDLTLPSTENANFFRTFNFMLRKLPLLFGDFYFLSKNHLKGKKSSWVDIISVTMTKIKGLKNKMVSFSLEIVLGGQSKENNTWIAGEGESGARTLFRQNCDRQVWFYCQSRHSFLLSPELVCVTQANPS